jgi:hypothetical protein
MSPVRESESQDVEIWRREIVRDEFDENIGDDAKSEDQGAHYVCCPGLEH